MDLDIIQSTKEGEITQFLCDVRDYFKASLATSEYENTSNMFYLTAAETTEKLLSHCECLLNRLKNTNATLPVNSIASEVNCFATGTNIQAKNHEWSNIRDNGAVDVGNLYSNNLQRNEKETRNDDVSYLDMSASHLDNISKHAKIVDLNSSGESDKTFRCSTLVVKQNKSFLHRLHDTVTTAFDSKSADEAENWKSCEDKFEEDAQIYDICQVATNGSDGEEDELEETQKPITHGFHFSLPNVDCPYMDLPAGHLSIKKSIKYGQLLKIEKRLFFDQSKKCYCGILNDWLLCYLEGPTSNRPTVSLYLKIPGIEIEHFGEGKRRDICFQISTSDPNKRFVFQAINEIDAKEWIHAIEAAIRSDTTGADVRNSSTRKLPTPPVMKKITFFSSFQGSSQANSNTTTISSDCIYEEPSPIQQPATNFSSENRPELPNKQNKPSQFTRKIEYDVPKCPPQPLNDSRKQDILLINPYESSKTDLPERTHTITLSDSLYLASLPSSAQKLNLKIEENLDFQAKVKDVHSKLTSQLSNGPNVKKSLKKTPSTTSQSETESLSLPSPTPPLSEAADLKKQKKNSSNSPQKMTNAKNWFLNRLNKTNSSTRSSSSSASNSPTKCKQSEKENLLNSSSDVCDGYDASVPTSGTSKVNMIINQLEASGHLPSMFNTDGAGQFNSLSDENDLNNYEPIMPISAPPSNIIKKI